MAAATKGFAFSQCVLCHRGFEERGAVYRLDPCGHHIDARCQKVFSGMKEIVCLACKGNVTEVSPDPEFGKQLERVDRLNQEVFSGGMQGALKYIRGELAGSRATQPVPSTISPEAREFLEAFEMFSWSPKTRSEWEALQKAVVEFGIPESEKAAQKYLQDVEEKEIAGVPVVISTPKEYETSNKGKIAIFFHGGAYTMHDHRYYHMVSAPVCHAMGVRVCSVGYRLAPQHPYPAGLEDGVAVYEALIKELGPANVVMYGDSAGAGLILAILQIAREKGLPMPAGIALMSPWLDVTQASDSLVTLEGADPIMGYDRTLRASAEAYVGAADPKDPRISPLYGQYDSSHPDVYLIGGGRDAVVSDLFRIQRAFRKALVGVTVDVFEGMWHDFCYNPDLPESQEATQAIAQFLTAKLGR